MRIRRRSLVALVVVAAVVALGAGAAVVDLDGDGLVDGVEVNSLAHFDNENRGYHHALVVADARLADSPVAGFATTGHVVAQTSAGDDGDAYTTREQAHVLMHELGHALGLAADRYTGIDTYTMPYDRYTSIMNYNAPREDLEYSTEDPFDDWASLETNMYAPAALEATLPIPTTANATAGNATETNATASTALDA